MALPAPADARVPMRRGRAGVSGPRGGGVYLSRVQQTRLLDAAVQVLAEEGLKRLSATRVSARAGMSTKTFYDLFTDSEECFLAVFDRAVEELAELLASAWAGDEEWIGRVRGALVVLLAALERDRALAGVVFVQALGAGPRVLVRRAEVLDRVAGFLDEGRVGGPAGFPELVAAGVTGAAFSVIHARLVEQSAGSLMELVGPVMATVVLPYRGRECAARELARPVPALPEPVVSPKDGFAGPQGGGADRSRREGPAHPAWSAERASDRGRRAAPLIAPVRLTERTCAVLASVGARPGANNRQVAVGAGASEPQISRLIARLAEHGLVENRGSGRGAYAKAWWLTDRGAEFLGNGRHLLMVTPRGQEVLREPRLSRGKNARPVAGVRPLALVLPADFRLTVRTQMALVAVADGGARGAYPSNREVAGRIGLMSRGTISHLMSRLQDQGLVENTRGRTKGLEKAWRLTQRGQEVLDAHHATRTNGTSEPAGVRGGKLVPKRARGRLTQVSPASPGLRLTVRTQLVLTAVAEHAGASNREIAEAAGVRDQGQISKLLARLQDRGLIHNTVPATPGIPKAWQLTPQGEALLHTSPVTNRRVV